MLFFLLAFLVAWVPWSIAAFLVPAGTLNQFTWSLLFLPGTFAPGIVAILLTWRERGRAGVQALVSRAFRWEVSPWWYVFAIFYPMAAKLSAALLHRVMYDVWPTFGTTPVLLMIAGALFSTPFQAGEELGWRGYALPRMARVMGLGPASLVLGVIWAAWHLPLFFIPGTDNSAEPFGVYVVTVTAISITFAWLYASTGGSLLLVMLIHASVNNSRGIVPSTGAPAMIWLLVAVLWSGALVFLYLMRGKTIAPDDGRSQ